MSHVRVLQFLLISQEILVLPLSSIVPVLQILAQFLIHNFHIRGFHLCSCWLWEVGMCSVSRLCCALYQFPWYLPVREVQTTSLLPASCILPLWQPKMIPDAALTWIQQKVEVIVYELGGKGLLVLHDPKPQRNINLSSGWLNCSFVCFSSGRTDLICVHIQARFQIAHFMGFQCSPGIPLP